MNNWLNAILQYEKGQNLNGMVLNKTGDHSRSQNCAVNSTSAAFCYYALKSRKNNTTKDTTHSVLPTFSCWEVHWSVAKVLIWS